MFNIEITPLVKTEIRPVPEAQLLDQLYHVFLDKGVHFRVEQVNDESIVFYWTHSNDYLCDTIAAEIGELLNPVAENAKVKAAETEQPKVEEPYSFTYTGPEAEAINDTLTAFYPTKVETKLEGEKLTIKWKWWDAALDEEISNLINEIVDNRLRLLTITAIGKEDADTFMRDIASWFPEKVRQWTYTDNTLTILLNYEPGIIGKLKTHLRDLAGARFLKNNEHSIDAIFREISSGIGCDCPACQKFR